MVKPLDEFLEPLGDQITPEGKIAPEIEEEYLWSKDKVYE
jgi:hypothetical protein